MRRPDTTFSQLSHCPRKVIVLAPLRISTLFTVLIVASCANQMATPPLDDSGSIGLWQDAQATSDLPSSGPDAVALDGRPEEAVVPPKPCLETLADSPVHTFFSKDCAAADLCPCSPADLGETIGHFIAPATQSVDLCVMELQDFSVTGAMVAAHKSGATVRTIVDDDYAAPEGYAIADLLEAGIPVLDDDNNAIMHSKFVVIDGATVIVTSANFSAFDSLSNANNLLVFRSPALASIFTTRFNQFWEQDAFHHVDQPGPFGASFSDIQVEVTFGPHWAVVEALLEAIESAEEAIHFAIFAFTLEEVKQAILKRCSEVEIRGLYDAGQAAGDDSMAPSGWCSSASVYAADVQPSPGVTPDYGFRKLHHKYLIIDPGTSHGQVITGSTNWSYSAATKNDEVLISVRHGATVDAFESEFSARFAEAK
jgi:phosphatidylserine/phosphatidylglycerophosphate/cardiolipin synthase-like enzyme